MANRCPTCGASVADGGRCRDRFDQCLVKEAEDPAYYAVHHLIVSTYMLQHTEYSRRGWLVTRDLLDRFVHRGLTPLQARREARVTLDSGTRTWSITKGPKLEGVDRIAWTYTITDVRLDTAEAYCADARRWADGVLADTEELVTRVRAEP